MRITEHRFARKIGQTIDRAGGGHGEEIEPFISAAARALRSARRVLALERVDGAVPATTQYDLLRRWPDAQTSVGALHERADRRRALGDPGPVVEKPRRRRGTVRSRSRPACRPAPSIARSIAHRAWHRRHRRRTPRPWCRECRSGKSCRWRASCALRPQRRGPRRHRRRTARTPTCSRASGKPAPCLRCRAGRVSA